MNKRFTNYDCSKQCWPKKIPSEISRNLQMSPNFNQNTRWILRSIFEVIKILVVNSRPLSHSLCDQWDHGVICKHKISKNQGLAYINVINATQSFCSLFMHSLCPFLMQWRSYGFTWWWWCEATKVWGREGRSGEGSCHWGRCAFRPIFELPFCMALPPRLGLGTSSASQGFFHRKGVLDSKIALRPRGGRGRRRVWKLLASYTILIVLAQ